MKISPKTTLATIPFLASALLGCKSSPKSALAQLPQGRGGGLADATFQRLGERLDNPNALFRAANYTPLWTASKEEAAAALPKGLSVMPKEARVWEPWFRKHITHKGQPLSTADILKMKWTVIQTVANDPACQFRPGQPESEIFQSVEAARIKALSSLGLDDSNPVIFQISRADAAFARVKSQRSYARSDDESVSELFSIEHGTNARYPTFSELNQKDFKLNCGRSALEMTYVLRGLEKIKPSGVKIGYSYVFSFHQDGKRGLHSISGIKIKLPTGEKAHLYYDSTANKGSFPKVNLSLLSRYSGPIDQVSLEQYTNRYCISVMSELPKGWKRDGKGTVGYEFLLGENYPEFGIGNFDRAATLPEGGWSYTSRTRGVDKMRTYHQQNLAKINALDKVINDVYSGK